MKWRVRVCHDNYGTIAVVILTRRPFCRFSQSGILVARLDLTREDAEQHLAEARAKAQSLRASLKGLEAT